MNNYFGFLNIDKPKGITSNKVTNVIKKLLNTKVGHIGTLDPLANGVLPIAIGKATKLVHMLEDVNKQYEFTIQFGKETSTGDEEGKILDESDYIPTLNECRSVESNFLGEITQLPSVFSAIKINGIRSYKLARQKQNLDSLDQIIRKPRKVKIFQILMKDYNYSLAQATYVVKCSKGTYIRSLAQDISKSLGTLGFVVQLTRIASGNFTLDNSCDFNQIKAYISNKTDKQKNIALDDYIKKNLLDINQLIYNIGAIHLCFEQAKSILNGSRVTLHSSNKTGEFIAYFKDCPVSLGEVKQDKIFYPKKVFLESLELE